MRWTIIKLLFISVKDKIDALEYDHGNVHPM